MTDKVYIVVEQFQDGDDGVAKCKTLCLNKVEAWSLAFKNTCDFITKNGGKMHLLKDGPPVNMDDYDVSKDESGSWRCRGDSAIDVRGGGSMACSI